jgi:UDP-N-acetyl-D-mannosaminuronic acid dehydrogenase
MVKLSENIFRDVNIALANELSMICGDLGLDALKVIELANRHPRVQILSPGPGVGGHCIPVDPWFVVAQAPHRARLIRTAREVNEAKTQFVLEAICAEAEKSPSARIACFGLAYKADVDDFRESPALEIALALRERFGCRSLAVEPYAEALCARDARASGLEFVAAENALRSADILVMLVAHSAFRTLARPQDKIIIDCVGLWR